jgi:hypothetical protein
MTNFYIQSCERGGIFFFAPARVVAPTLPQPLSPRWAKGELNSPIWPREFDGLWRMGGQFGFDENWLLVLAVLKVRGAVFNFAGRDWNSRRERICGGFCSHRIKRARSSQRFSHLAQPARAIALNWHGAGTSNQFRSNPHRPPTPSSLTNIARPNRAVLLPLAQRGEGAGGSGESRKSGELNSKLETLEVTTKLIAAIAHSTGATSQKWYQGLVFAKDFQ